MGELAKRRAARDVWVSRGHLQAALVGSFLLSGISFGLGYLTGSHGATDGAARARLDVGFGGNVPGDDLVGLLARVEANRAALGGVESLTFPEELARSADDAPVGPAAPVEVLVAPEHPQVNEGATVHISGVQSAAPALPRPPVGSYTVVVATVASPEAAEALAETLGGCALGGSDCPAALEGLSPWVGASIVDGTLVYSVSLGGFATRAAAEQARAGLVELPDTRGAVVQPIP